MNQSKAKILPETESLFTSFVAESRELLLHMEDSLLRIESGCSDGDAIGAVFRPAHTIKGNAGVFGLEGVVAFTHMVESVLDCVRAGTLGIDADLVALLLECTDHMGQMIDRLAEPCSDGDTAHAAMREKLERALSGYLGRVSEEPSTPGAVAPPLTAPESTAGSSESLQAKEWQISARPNANSLRDGMDPLSILHYLATLGDIVYVETLVDAIPPLSSLDPETCYLAFELRLRTTATLDAIESAFTFIRDGSDVMIAPCPWPAAESDPPTLESASATSTGSAKHGSPISSAPPPPSPDGNARSNPSGSGGNREAQFVRVRADKLDELINRVGELVIASASVSLSARRTKDSSLYEATSTLSRLVEEIREDALSLRMVQIGETFNRFRRVVRDVSRELDKDVELAISGGETELDKTVIEKIGDPLMHLVRNSLDHGIESAEERARAGKPTRGTLCLDAYHDSGSIVIEVSDDGRGLNKEKILQKARERGLINTAQTLQDAEIHALVFEAGFSTATQVTNLSGRGVGMDVVRRNIEALRGSVQIESKQGIHTTVRIRLPLTLAIIDGFLVGVGSNTYVIPLDSVVECVELPEQEAADAEERGYVNLRGRALPCFRLSSHFALARSKQRRENIVVVDCGGQRAGIVVDDLFGEYQTVIKPLGRLFSDLRGISGSTILGSGDVALILDIAGLMQRAAEGPQGRAVVSERLLARREPQRERRV